MRYVSEVWSKIHVYLKTSITLSLWSSLQTLLPEEATRGRKGGRKLFVLVPTTRAPLSLLSITSSRSSVTFHFPFRLSVWFRGVISQNIPLPIYIGFALAYNSKVLYFMRLCILQKIWKCTSSGIDVLRVNNPLFWYKNFQIGYLQKKQFRSFHYSCVWMLAASCSQKDTLYICLFVIDFLKSYYNFLPNC